MQSKLFLWLTLFISIIAAWCNVSLLTQFDSKARSYVKIWFYCRISTVWMGCWWLVVLDSFVLWYSIEGWRVMLFVQILLPTPHWLPFGIDTMKCKQEFFSSKNSNKAPISKPSFFSVGCIFASMTYTLSTCLNVSNRSLTQFSWTSLISFLFFL